MDAGYKKVKEDYIRTLKTVIDNRCIEDEIEGFRTENVYGRGMVGRHADIHSNESGDYVGYNRYSTRELTIKYQLKAKNNNDYMRKLEILNGILDTGGLDVEIRFTDDRFVYYGQVTEVEVVKDDNNWIVGEFTITCCDYKKYGEYISLTNILKFNYSYTTPIIPSDITLRVNNDCEKLKVVNLRSRKFIELMGEFRSGDVININTREQSINKGAQNLLKYLNIESNLEDFELVEGDEIQASNCSVDIKYRETRI